MSKKRQISITKGNEKASAITAFAQKPWVIIVGWLVAGVGALGGIQGYIGFKEYLDKKPGFEYACSNIMRFERVDISSGKPEYYFLLSGSVMNDGEKPLFPKGFKLKAQYKKNKILGQGTAIWNDSLSFPTPTGIVTYRNATKKDLQALKVITTSEPIYGLLLFKVSSTFDFNDSKNYKMQLICIDLKGKEYSSTLILPDENSEIPTKGVYPKDEVEVR
jgi:hypothetical protein